MKKIFTIKNFPPPATIIIYDLLIKMNVCIYSAVVKNFRIGDHSSEPTDFMAQILLLCF